MCAFHDAARYARQESSASTARKSKAAYKRRLRTRSALSSLRIRFSSLCSESRLDASLKRFTLIKDLKRREKPGKELTRLIKGFPSHDCVL